MSNDFFAVDPGHRPYLSLAERLPLRALAGVVGQSPLPGPDKTRKPSINQWFVTVIVPICELLRGVEGGIHA